MHDSLLVRGIQRIRDLPRDGQRLADRYRSSLKSSRQCFAHHELEHEAAHPVRLFQPVNRADVWVIESRQQACFALEARQPLRIVRKGARKDLDCHCAPELRVACAVHLAHAADTDARFDLIGAEMVFCEDRPAHVAERRCSGERETVEGSVEGRGLREHGLHFA